MNALWRYNTGVPGWIAACLLPCLLAVPIPAGAQDDGFVVRTAFTELVDGNYQLYADIDYGLNERALEALENGVPLTFEVEILVLRFRRFMWNETVSEIKKQYQLVYHPLAESFSLRDLHADTQVTYRNFRAAVNELGQISGLPVIEEDALDADSPYQVRMRVRLLVESLPEPMRWLAYLFPHWRQASEWYAWVLRS